MGNSASTGRKMAYKNLITAKDLASELFEAGATAQNYKLKKDVMKKVINTKNIQKNSLIFHNILRILQNKT